MGHDQSPARRFVVPDSTLFEDLGGETVLLNLSSGIYFRLDEVASRIWADLKAHGDPDRMVESMVEEYDVEPQLARRDLDALLKDLVVNGLIQRTGDNDPPP